jgi:hypothetical protein
MRLLAFFVLFNSLCNIANARVGNDSIASSEDLINAVYSKYSNNWYKHLTFKQDMFRYRDDSLIRNEIWVVAYSAPSNLHIRFNDFDSGRGWIISNDSLYSFNHNKLIGQRPRLHEIMTLGLDVYVVEPEITLSKIRDMNIDISRFAEVIINGNSVFQVGDPGSICFWFHSKSLLFYGLRKVSELGVRDTYFEAYKNFYGKPVATQVQYYQDGKMYFYEKYFEIRLPTLFPSEVFNPNLFDSTRW